MWPADLKRHLKSKHGQQKSTLKQQQPYIGPIALTTGITHTPPPPSTSSHIAPRTAAAIHTYPRAAAAAPRRTAAAAAIHTYPRAAAAAATAAIALKFNPKHEKRKQKTLTKRTNSH